MTKDEIEVEVQRLIKLAERIAAVAEKLNGIIGDEYNGSLEELQKSWGGENSGGLLSAGVKIGQDAAETIKGLAAAAEALARVAKEYGEAETKAIATAKS